MKQIKFQHPALEYCKENDFKDFILVPGQYEVCPTCQGEGTHVRRDIDDSLLVDSMREDGDDEGIQAYFNGAYDTACTQCGGMRVILQPNEGALPDWAQDAIWEWGESERETCEIQRQERAMGA